MNIIENLKSIGGPQSLDEHTYDYYKSLGMEEDDIQASLLCIEFMK
jgi:hypothetical protein